MTVYRVDPVRDPRWDELVRRHPRASVFHTPGWLKALQFTYNYEPLALTTYPPGGELRNGLVFCRIESWLTGRRMVSLPFSDHCNPLVDSPDDLDCLLSGLKREAENASCKYVEVRPLGPVTGSPQGFNESQNFYLHELDLRSSLEQLFGNSHRNSCQRKIRRAERAGLVYESGRSELLLKKFYALLLQTRHRHRLPPQPLKWFRNLMILLGDKLTIRVASKDGVPIASLLALHYKDTLVDKYGGSDARFHNLGAIPFLFWKTIREAKDSGISRLDMGRTDCDAKGLVNFKERWGARRCTLSYYRCAQRVFEVHSEGWRMRTAKIVFAHMPGVVLISAGKLLYRHIG